VFAGDESRFSSAEGLVQATVSGGPVHIELPVGVHPLTLEVGGRIWLRSLSSGTEYSVSPLDAAENPLRFVVPDAGA
jgi:hypothetical protein